MLIKPNCFWHDARNSSHQQKWSKTGLTITKKRSERCVRGWVLTVGKYAHTFAHTGICQFKCNKMCFVKLRLQKHATACVCVHEEKISNYKNKKVPDIYRGNACAGATMTCRRINEKMEHFFFVGDTPIPSGCGQIFHFLFCSLEPSACFIITLNFMCMQLEIIGGKTMYDTNG